MKVCPRCSVPAMESRFVCEQCGTDLVTHEQGVYGRGFLAILQTRAGMRIALMLVAVFVVGVLGLLGVIR